MELHDALLLAQVVVIPLIFRVWKMYRDRVEDVQLRDTLDVAVRAAEELSASGELGRISKKAFVLNFVQKKLPDSKLVQSIDQEDLDVLIRAACQLAGVGASHKAPVANVAANTTE